MYWYSFSNFRFGWGNQRILRLSHIAKPIPQERLEEAFSAIRNFIDRPVKNLLLVEDNEVQRNSILELIGNGDVKTTAVANGAEALAALKA